MRGRRALSVIGQPVGGRGEVEDELQGRGRELEEVRKLGDPRPGDAHPCSQGGLGEVGVGVELAAEIPGLQEQPLDGRGPDGAGALVVEGLGVLLAEEVLLAVPGAAKAEGTDVVERGFWSA
jgi:hypothetical protein